MELTALSGEFPADLLWRLGMGGSYGGKIITRLKDERLLKTHYRDKLRGYRLSSVGKKVLLAKNPERFSFYLTGSSDTNQPRSEPPRRLRLHQTARTYQLLTAAGIEIFRDRKPNLFQAGEPAAMQALPCPVYYHSREIKELGMETVKVNNSRTMGVLLSDSTVYVIYYTGDCAMKWSYNTEIKLKAILQHHLNQGVLSRHYCADTQIHAIMVGTDMYTASVLMRSTGGYHKCCFALDTSYDYFHFVPDTPAGEALIKLLSSPPLLEKLAGLLGADLQPPDREAFDLNTMQSRNRESLCFLPMTLTCWKSAALLPRSGCTSLPARFYALTSRRQLSWNTQAMPYPPAQSTLKNLKGGFSTETEIMEAGIPASAHNPADTLCSRLSLTVFYKLQRLAG